MKQSRGLVIAGLLLFVCTAVSFSASAAPVVLVTGFEPFSNYTVNPSQLIAETLNGTIIGNASVVGLVLPVDFNSSIHMTIQAIEQHHPVLVISTGLNARAHEIKVENIGVNLKRYPKDDGTWSFPRRVCLTGPFLRITSLETRCIVREIRNAGIPVQMSFFAGTYICNSVLYQTLGYVAEEQLITPVGFIHVPLLDSQDSQGMPLQDMVDAVEIAIETSLK